MTKIKLIISALILSLSLGGAAYAKNDKEKKLPPGLQKKAESGKILPRGRQKKVEVGETLEQELCEQGKVVEKDADKGLVTISVEGKLIRVIENTREIVEILEGL